MRPLVRARVDALTTLRDLVPHIPPASLRSFLDAADTATEVKIERGTRQLVEDERAWMRIETLAKLCLWAKMALKGKRDQTARKELAKIENTVAMLRAERKAIDTDDIGNMEQAVFALGARS